MGKPLSEARVALVTTGGFVPPGAVPFRTGKRGDPTFRVIPHGLDPAALSIHHPHYDHGAARRDVNVLFPYPLLQALADEGVVGRAASHHYSFMGYIPLTRALEKKYAPQVVGMIEAEGVDAALLVPA
ncbi:MAG: hypothetical protein HY702_04375 [Gemmatimonadetes bacterium]|nr:hypothetical protein [Gemmatimonadota bacterium]